MTETSPNADEVFVSELVRMGLQFTVNEDGLYEIAIGEINATVNLENVRRNYERDNDPEMIAHFAQQLAEEFFDQAPNWEDAKPFLRFCIEPADYENGFVNTLCQKVNDTLVKVFVLASPDGSRITWISKDMVSEWDVNVETVVALAEENMDAIASDTLLESQDAGGVSLGMLNTQEREFKASLILCSKFREVVSPSHGWPVYVVAPARDFVYVIPKANADSLGRLGTVVMREYSESGHPVTQEVLEVSNEGVRAIGSFARKQEG
ncbi:MAG: hypothetical protein AAF483_24595 [Planctomycetota bacterium]